MNTTNDFSRARRAFAIALAAAALAFAALWSVNASGETATASATKSVKIAGFAFTPKTMTVATGTKVAFSNSDSAPHTATGKGFKTGTISKGKTKSVTFAKKGTFAYHCSIHPTMKGTIVVN
ncbi:MAG TPA: cupredoxin domain-containing protein [Solirubrobacterales bacterium]|nr:cupredoxin domain-containing protein [Solirubrobacterales bacterium]